MSKELVKYMLPDEVKVTLTDCGNSSNINNGTSIGNNTYNDFKIYINSSTGSSLNQEHKDQNDQTNQKAQNDRNELVAVTPIDDFNLESLPLKLKLGSKVRIIRKIERYYKSVVIENYECKLLQPLMLANLKHLSRCLTHLKFIDCDFDVMALCAFLRELPQLESLELNMNLAMQEYGLELAEEVIPALMHLTDFKIEINDMLKEVLNITSNASNIKTLSLFKATFDIDVFNDYLERNNSLETLSLTQCFIRELKPKSHLKTMDLSSINIPLNNFKSRCLTHLKFLDCELDVMTLFAFLRDLPLLKPLELNMNWTMIEKCLELIEDDIPSLVNLTDIEILTTLFMLSMHHKESTRKVSNNILKSLFKSAYDINNLNEILNRFNSLTFLSFTDCIIGELKQISHPTNIHSSSKIIKKQPPKNLQIHFSTHLKFIDCEFNLITLCAVLREFQRLKSLVLDMNLTMIEKGLQLTEHEIPALTNLTRLEIIKYSAMVKEVLSITRKASNIEMLSLCDVFIEVSDINDYLEPYNRLKMLCLWSCVICDLEPKSHQTNIQSSSTNLPPNNFKGSFLTYLGIFDCDCDLITLCALLRELPLLRSLELNTKWIMKEKHLELTENDIPALKHLTKLEIDINTEMTEEVLNITSNASKIRKLSLSNATIDINVFNDYLERHNRLETLKLMKCIIGELKPMSNLTSSNNNPPKNFKGFECLNNLKYLLLEEVNDEMLDVLNNKYVQRIPDLDIIFTKEQNKIIYDFICTMTTCEPELIETYGERTIRMRQTHDFSGMNWTEEVKYQDYNDFLSKLKPDESIYLKLLGKESDLSPTEYFKCLRVRNYDVDDDDE